MITKGINIKTRTYFSIHHIESAALFSRLSYEIENNSYGKISRELISTHKSYVISSIISSVSFLEANINEFFADISDETLSMYDEGINNLCKKNNNFVKGLWDKGIPRTAKYTLLEKYQIALLLYEKNEFDKSKNPYQDISSLVKLRNALIHYEPEWVDDHSNSNYSQKDAYQFEKIFNKKFKANPLVEFENRFYPDKLLGHGCAEWSVYSSIKFVDDFSARLGIEPKFNYLRDSLITR